MVNQDKERKNGETGQDIFLKVPLGTEILDENQQIILEK